MRWLRVLAVGFCACAAVPKGPARPTPEPTPLTQASKQKGSIELASLDATVDPCDDFYRYACGGWMKSHPIPDDRATWGRGSAIADANLTSLRVLLEREATTPSDDDGEKLGAFWATCMDEEKANDLGPIRRELAEIDRVVDAASFARAVAHLHRFDSSILFDVWAAQDFEDASRQILHIGQSRLGLPDRDYYFDDPKAPDPRKKQLRAAYAAHIAAMLELAGTREVDAKRDAAAILGFETKLASSHLARVELRDPKNRYHLLPRTWLDQHAKGFAWNEWFSRVGVERIKTLDIAQPAFFVRLGELVRTTPAHDLRAYLRWRLLSSFAPTLSAPLVDENFRFWQAFTGAKVLAPRWKRCVNAADRSMDQALGRLFAREVLGEEGRARAGDVLGSVLGAMDDALAAVDWMDEPTRTSAKAKLHAVRTKVGYPTERRDYGPLVVGRNSHFDNVSKANAFALARELETIDRPVDRDEWSQSPSTGDCFYRWSVNDITVPAGMLKPPLFGVSMTRAMQFGALGSYLGHEVTHAFDDQGRKFDAEGRQRDWWSPPSATTFEARAACVRNQFDAATVLDGVHVNGRLTLGESLADLGGMKLAWTAFQKARSESPSTERFDLSEDEQFFIAYGQWWCRNLRDEALRTMIATDPHAPPEHRVNLTLANTPAFAATFQCKPGSKMVHAPRCDLW